MNAITSLLYVPNVCATKADGADKGSKLLKTCLAVFKEMCASSAVLFPMPLANLNTAIGQLNSVNTLFQIPFRYGEWSANKWGKREGQTWSTASDGFKSKALLTAALVVEGVRILQANYVLPVTQNLFTVMGKVPVFQTASKVMNSFPAGSYLSTLALKVSGLEMIKNILFISSSVYALKKACADYERAQGEHACAMVDRAVSDLSNVNFARERIARLGIEKSSSAYQEEVTKMAGALDQMCANYEQTEGVRSPEIVNGIVTNLRNQQFERQRIARLDIEKSSRAYWKEVTKLTVLGTASAIVLGFIASPVLLTMFNTVTVATAAFNLWCVVKDVQAEDQRAEIRQQALAAPRADEEEVGVLGSASAVDVTNATAVASTVFPVDSDSDE